MNTAHKIIHVIVTLLSIAAAVPKISQAPQEVQFFAAVGLPPLAVAVFGCVQLLGGVLLIIPRTRLWGALIAALAFLCSAIMLLMAGQMAFGLVSLVPAALAAAIAKRVLSSQSADGAGAEV